MLITPFRVNTFIFFKMPLGWLSGMRVRSLEMNKCSVDIKYKWLNQNPFRSMFWAAQGMAAELTAGVLIMNAIENSNNNISMLVTHQEGTFFKKATGRIIFTCIIKNEIHKAITKTISSGLGEEITLKSEGRNSEGELVSRFLFRWSLKLKN